MKKSFVSLVLALVMLAASVPLQGYAASDEEYEYEAEVLEQLGIAKGEIFYEPDAKIKRMDFAVLVAGLRGFDGTKSSGSSFIDIDSVHYASDSITYLKSLDIFEGYEDATFRGENTITFAEAAKVLTVMLGYEKHAEISGGWKTGYLNVAASLNLNSGMKVGADSAITQKQAIKMVYNALDKNICSVEFSGAEDLKLVSDYGKTPLSEWLHLEKTDGLVKTVGDLAVTRDKTASNIVTIGEAQIYLGDFDCYDYLGKYCEAYYYDDKSERSGELAAIAVITGKNDITVINTEDVTAFEDGILSYEDGRKIQKVKITKNDEVSLNGDPVAAEERQNALLNSDGTIMINELGKGDIELIALISSYETYVVSAVNKEDRIVYGEFGKKLEIDDDAKITVIDENSKEAEFSDIAADSVITVRKNSAASVVLVYISKTVEEGEFNGSYTKDGTLYNKIGSTEFKLTSDYRDNASLIEHGSSVTAYIDKFGRIAYIKAETNAYTYGFLYKLVPDEENDDEMIAKFYKLSGEFVTYNTSEKIKVDGDRADGNDGLMALLGRGEDSMSYYRLIRYTLNSEGKINKIDTAYKGTSEPKDSLKMIFQGYTNTGDQKEALVYKPRGGSFENRILYDKSATKALTVPKTYNGNTEYFILGKTLSEDDKVAFNAYISNENQLTPDVILFYLANDAGSAKEMIANELEGVITSLETTIDEDDLPVYNLTVDTGYGVKSYVTHKDFDAENVVKYKKADNLQTAYQNFVDGKIPAEDMGLKLSVGDFIEIAEDSLGKMLFCRKMVDGATGERVMDETDAGSIYGDRYVYGMLYQNDGSRIKVASQKDFGRISENSFRYYIMSGAAVYRVRTGKKAYVEKITISDLVDYKAAGNGADKVIVFSAAAAPKLVVAYEE